mgnify:FL=1
MGSRATRRTIATALLGQRKLEAGKEADKDALVAEIDSAP